MFAFSKLFLINFMLVCVVITTMLMMGTFMTRTQDFSAMLHLENGNIYIMKIDL